ncbi:hypothetical protein [Amycolatopsis tolypomycina]|uniref:Uncharacterized protein n=1 Tax=Amycolatopsis tolypomycina TaxID=208445 RepID=A0A1H4T0I7_9PSEU|nr:hypothetical protein [Amycolatopsis tolypomycina]SEC49828.1 hypothetical protein SAMN04489727_3972 [Amycolatopsis tolypomycina]
MEVIEAMQDLANPGVEPLSFGAPAVDPTACTWAIAAATFAGFTVGAGVGWVNCHYHGCVQQADDVEVPEGVAGLPVAELLGMRNQAATQA